MKNLSTEKKQQLFTPLNRAWLWRMSDLVFNKVQKVHFKIQIGASDKKFYKSNFYENWESNTVYVLVCFEKYFLNYKIFHKVTLLSSTLWFVVPLQMAFLRFMSWNVEFYIIGLSSYITHPPDMWHLGKIETSKWSLFEQWTENMFVLRGTFKSKAPLRVQFLPALGEGGGKGLKPKLLLGFTK